MAGPRSASQTENITEFTTCEFLLNAKQFFSIVSKYFDRATFRSMLKLIKNIIYILIKSFNSVICRSPSRGVKQN